MIINEWKGVIENENELSYQLVILEFKSAEKFMHRALGPLDVRSCKKLDVRFTANYPSSPVSKGQLVGAVSPTYTQIDLIATSGHGHHRVL